jgi:uncharacterized membrane protein YeiH
MTVPFTTQSLQDALTAKLALNFGTEPGEATDQEMLKACALVLRDVMAGDMPYIFVKHIYACASLVGAVICGVLRQSAGEMTAMLVGAAAVFAIRCLSAHYRWNLPHPNA